MNTMSDDNPDKRTLQICTKAVLRAMKHLGTDAELRDAAIVLNKLVDRYEQSDGRPQQHTGKVL